MTSGPASDSIGLRPATRADVERLVRFNRAMAWETERRTLDPERLRQGTLAVFEQPSRGFYVVAEAATTPAQVVGQMLVTFEWSDWRNATFWWMQSVYVDPAWRRRGVFRRFYHYVLAEARRRKDVCGFRLYVDTYNQTAQRVYAHLGLTRSTYLVYEEDFVLSTRAEGSQQSVDATP
ncbi:MAG: GNAT family N-acetyltransferase [Nitrospirales bacterium]